MVGLIETLSCHQSNKSAVWRTAQAGKRAAHEQGPGCVEANTEISPEFLSKFLPEQYRRKPADDERETKESTFKNAAVAKDQKFYHLTSHIPELPE